MDPVGRLIRDGNRVGTAFVVTREGLAATTQHVIGCHAAAEWTFEPFAARALSLPVDVSLPADEEADVALIQIGHNIDWQPMTLGSVQHLLPGAPVHLRGFADSYDFDSGIGKYVGPTAPSRVGEARIDDRVWHKVDCRHAQPGMSGAPVVATGRGYVIGLVSTRLNHEVWNSHTVWLSRTEDLVALAPDQLELASPDLKRFGGTLRLSWDKPNGSELILETDEFNVTIGRNFSNRICLEDPRDSRFHGKLHLKGHILVYDHLGSSPTYVLGATRQETIGVGGCVIEDKDRLQFASGIMLVEFSAPDLYDPGAKPTEWPDDPASHV